MAGPGFLLKKKACRLSSSSFLIQFLLAATVSSQDCTTKDMYATYEGRKFTELAHGFSMEDVVFFLENYNPSGAAASAAWNVSQIDSGAGVSSVKYSGNGPCLVRDAASGYIPGCLIDNMTFYANLTISKTLSTADRTFACIYVRKAPAYTSPLIGELPLKFQDCQDASLADYDDHMNITVSGRSDFQSEQKFQCLNNSHLVVNDQKCCADGIVFTQTCNETADWEPDFKPDCWYAPETQLNFSQTPESQFLYAGQKLLLKCNITKQGSPKNYSKEYFVDDALIPGGELVLERKHAGALVYCQALDISYNKTIPSSSSDGKSALVRIDVRYPPEPAGNTEVNMSLNVESGKDITLQFQFQANPNSTLDSMTFTHSGPGTHDTSEIDIHDGCPGDICELKNDISKQTFLYKIPNVNQSRDGVYTLKVSSPDDHFVDDVLVMWINLTVVDQDPHDPRDPQTIIIIVVSVAVGLILILVGILIYMIRRKRAKGGKKQHSQHTPGGGDSDKQEKENPLYGTAGHFEKEERANPLYGTAGAVIEEATYSEVKKDKKTKKKGKENPGFSGENMGDTYAEVKKPKKTASTSAAVEPEVTYAALNKKKKKGPDQNVLHGSSEM